MSNLIAFSSFIILPATILWSFKVVKRIFTHLDQTNREKSNSLYAETTMFFNLIENLYQKSTAGRTSRHPSLLLILFKRNKFLEIGDKDVTLWVNVSHFLLFIHVFFLVFWIFFIATLV